MATEETDSMIQNLKHHDSRLRKLAEHVLAIRKLNPQQEKRIRDLRDDSEHRPWVRMAALNTLMEIEREKHAALKIRKMLSRERN